MMRDSGGIIRVLVVEDSPVMCKIITNVLNADPQIIVVGVAHNGKEAVELVPRLQPDIITMDMHMPVMDGLEATKEIMAYNPTPILVVSTTIFKAGMEKVFEAISYGALDVIEKGEMEVAGDKASGEKLIEKVKFLSKVNVIHHPLAKLENRKVSLEKENKIGKNRLVIAKGVKRIVAIAASTGGPQALHQLLKTFSGDFPCGIVVVQHITSGFIDGLVEWLNDECAITVKVAEDSEEIKPGVVYFAPCDIQMRVEQTKCINLINEPPRDGHLPSGDVLLESVAKVYKEGAIAVILTGMGRDAAVGMSSVKQMRGKTIAQDEKSSIVFGMPRAAIEMNAIDKVLSLEKIPEAIFRMLSSC